MDTGAEVDGAGFNRGGVHSGGSGEHHVAIDARLDVAGAFGYVLDADDGFAEAGGDDVSFFPCVLNGVAEGFLAQLFGIPDVEGQGADAVGTVGKGGIDDFADEADVVDFDGDGVVDGVAGDLVLMAAFITSELKTAFEIGFLIFIPFLIIDLVVASVLMSMGMMMLSPMIVSLPFKLMLFVLVDGWTLLMGTLASSFYMGAPLGS